MTSPPPGHKPPDREPRFAGSVAWVPSNLAEPQSGAQEAFSREATVDYGAQIEPTPAIALEPVVQYESGPESEDEPAFVRAVPAWSPPVLTFTGGGLAVIGSLLTWATLRLASATPDTSISDDNTSNISYNGLSLLEGRALLVVGLVAGVLAVLTLTRRIRPSLAATVTLLTGAAGLIAALFAAIGHPAELSTLFRSYRQIGSVQVSLPNGVGVWLAMGGAALIVISGLLTRINEAE